MSSPLAAYRRRLEAGDLVPDPDQARAAERLDALAEALKRGGSAVDLERLPGQGLRGHAEINRRMGDPDYAGTPIVDAWLKRVLG